MNKYLIILLIVLVIVLIGTVSYTIFQNQKLIKLTTISSPSPISSPVGSPLVSVSPSVSPLLTWTRTQVEENIEAAVNSRNFAALASFMTKPKVGFSLMSTECCPSLTPDEAAVQMDYIDEGIPLDFNQNTDRVKNLKSKNSQLAETFVGISKNKEHLAAFTLDEQNRITAIQLAVTWKLYQF